MRELTNCLTDDLRTLDETKQTRPTVSTIFSRLTHYSSSGNMDLQKEDSRS